MTRFTPAWLAPTLAALTAVTAMSAGAQTVYRVVQPDGRVVFTDRPPTTAAPGPGASGPAADGGPGLPYELRQAVARFPVTLYSGTDCTPCDAGRQLLAARGVPFAERTVTTPEDLEALRRMGGEGSLPLLAIGAQRINGYAPANWMQYLDAAGYPRASLLPPGYRPSAPQPAAPPPAAPAAATAPAPAAAAPSAPAAAPAVRPDPGNGTGFRF